MKKENILFSIIGIIIGFIGGFMLANNINRNAVSQQNLAQNQTVPPFLNQQTADIKPTQSGMMPDVAETLKKAEDEPDNYEAQIKAGDMYAQIQRFDKAADYYEKAVQIKPDEYEMIVKIGNTYLDSGQFEKAGNWYEKALKKKPDDVNVRTDYGITFVEREHPDYDRAIKEFQTSLKTNPKHEATIYNLGIAYLKKGSIEETQKALSQLEQINPNGQLAQRLKQLISQ